MSWRSGTWRLAVTNGCSNLVTAVDSFVKDNFSKIIASPEFLEYPLANVSPPSSSTSSVTGHRCGAGEVSGHHNYTTNLSE